ncbi:MAG: hypothetical protein WCO56_23375 [Verrucomicrobiota bacterium]
MNKWSIIIAAVLVAVWLIVTTVRDFADAVRHFSSQPRDLLYVLAIAMLGGFAALGFTRLSPRMQRHVRVFAWGAAASTLTLFVGYFAFHLSSLSSLAVESGGSAWVGLALLLFSGITAYLWFEFYRAWKTGVSH